MRIFIPATGNLLAGWVAAGALTGLTAGHAATPALRREYGDGTDDEELEYVALVEASLSSLDLLAQDPDCEAKRVVLALDLDMAVAPRGDQRYPSLVRIADTIPLDAVVSVHVDDDDAVPAVRAATAALAGGSPEADPLVDEVAEFEMMWFDATELREVASARGGRG